MHDAGFNRPPTDAVLRISAASIAAVCMVIILVAAAAPESLASSLEYNRPAILAGELWRLWTGHLVHFSVQHAVMDGIALFVAGRVTIRLLGIGRFWLHFFWIAPMISVGLMWWSPTLMVYRGLSGIAVALMMLAAIALYRASAPSRPWVAFFCVVMALKTIAEANGFTMRSANLPADVQVEWRAHVLGALGAAMVMTWRHVCEHRLQSRWEHRWRHRSQQRPQRGDRDKLSILAR